MDQSPKQRITPLQPLPQAVAELACQVKLLAQRMEAGFAGTQKDFRRLDSRLDETRGELGGRMDKQEAALKEVRVELIGRIDQSEEMQAARLAEVKADLSARIEAIDRKIEFDGRAAVAVIAALSGTVVALAATIAGRVMQWW